MDTVEKLYEQIDNRITRLEDKVDPLLEFVAQQKVLHEAKKEKIVTLRDFVSVSISGSIAAIVAWALTKGQ